MKKFAIATAAAVCLLAQPVLAQWKTIKGEGSVSQFSRQVESFKGVSVGGSMDVVVEKGNPGKVAISAEANLEPYITTEVKDGNLHIGVKKGYNISSKNIKITVWANELSSVAVAGSGSIKTPASVSTTDRFAVSVAGSGNVETNANSNAVVASIAGSGTIAIQGKASKLNISISGSGDYKGYDLATSDAKVSISGSGNAQTTVNGALDVHISGSGDVRYKGNAQVSLKAAGSGKVYKAAD